MKTYLDIVINDNCFNILPDLKSDSINLIVIDPPYEINYLNQDWDKVNSLDWNILFKEFHRILKPTGNLIIFQGWSSVCNTISCGQQYFTLKNWIIYDRIKGRGSKTNLVSTREDILWFIKSEDYTYNKIYSTIVKKTKGMGSKNGQECRALSNVWTDIAPIVPWSKERVEHPTQKPIQIMERIITIYSNPQDMILDCFAGSGSTLVAAKNLNRRFIGIEKNEEYSNLARSRLAEQNSVEIQPDIFN